MGDEELPSAYSLKSDADDAAKEHSWGFTGKGTATYMSGDVFVGEYVDGKKHGAGQYTYRNGDVFTGTYVNNMRSGLGKMIYADGSCYDGHYEQGVRSGEGTFIYPNKDVYSGGWKQNKKSGEGFYVFAESKYYYKGTWKDGQIITGQWVFSPTFCYEGKFVKQKPCGVAKFCGDGYEITGQYTQEVKPLDSARDDADNIPQVEVQILWETFGMSKV